MTQYHFKLADDEQSIQLDKLLKMVNLVGSGSEARAVIVDGMVALNGATEWQGRKEIKPGDTVVFNENTIQVN